jgi:undecaprenyl-diphosphatase
MFAATGYKMLKAIMEEGGVEMLQSNLSTLIIGNVVAFIVAMLAIKFFITFLTKYGFKAFGYYRIVAGIAIIVLMMLGFDLSVI